MQGYPSPSPGFNK